MTEIEIEATRARYVETLSPAFFPADPVSQDIIRYFASLLRIVGMEDGGWDPHLESRALLEDLNSLMQVDLTNDRFPDPDSTRWRVGLLFYSHIVEMDAPYEVLANLLRFQTGKGYSPAPFFTLLSKKEQKTYKSRRLSQKRRIEILRQLGDEAGISVAPLFDDFYNSELRNAIAHSDFILTDEDFRSRGGTGGFKPLRMSLERVNELVTKAKLFIGTFLSLEVEARRTWGLHRGRGIPYDSAYKGLMEVLVDEADLLCGFKVHWPNNSESVYRRTAEGVEMTNCSLALDDATISLFVGSYARDPGMFSPLVEKDRPAIYTPLEGLTAPLQWDATAS